MLYDKHPETLEKLEEIHVVRKYLFNIRQELNDPSVSFRKEFHEELESTIAQLQDAALSIGQQYSDRCIADLTRGTKSKK